VDLRRLRRLATTLLQDLLAANEFDLGICLVSATEITRLNETFLRHKGSTDVITFNYAEKGGPVSGRSRGRDAHTAPLHGEIFVCVDEAVSQARRFRTIWQSELVRYVVHGVLHLVGYDDRASRARRRMRAAEDALVRRLARQFVFRSLSRPRTGSRT
jgi:rRNA maturation RNase YbeY